jgi:hypothetical protein
MFQPVLFDQYEIIIMRLLFAIVLYDFTKFNKVSNFKNQPKPVGLARFIDITFISNYRYYKFIRIVIIILLCLYVIGYKLYFVTFLLSSFVLIFGTLWNSQGSINHSRQVVSLVLIVQSLAYILGATKNYLPWDFKIFSVFNVDQISIFWSQQAMVAVYFTSSLSKLILSKFNWINQVKYIPIQIEKTLNQKYYDTLKSDDNKNIRKISDFLLKHSNITIVIFSTGLILEILSPLSLINRTSIGVFGILLLLFHIINSKLMNLGFPELQKLLVIFFINIPFLIFNIYEYIVIL